MGNNKHSRDLHKFLCIALLAAAVLLSAAARMVPGFAQWYSTAVYPALQGTLGRLSGAVPFSVSEILCILLPLLLILDIRHLRRIFSIVCILAFLYTACCGVNYYRDPFVDPAAYQGAEFTDDDLRDFCEYTVGRLQIIYNESDPDGENDPEGMKYPDKHELAGKAVKAMTDLALKDGDSIYDTAGLSGFYPVPKYMTVLSRLFSMMGVSGIYSPFTIEANVNGEMPGLEMPFTSCHELSHLKGFMNEGEANFIGWLACINSDDAAFNRSGWLIAWIYAGNSLYGSDPDAYASLREKLPDAAVRELEDNNEFWATHENRASEVQDRVNDAYLKSNGQDQGIKTYGQLTTLMLLWFHRN